MKKSIIIATAVAALVMAGCRHDSKEPAALPQEDTVAVDDISGATQTDAGEAAATVQTEGYFARKTKGYTPQASAPQTAPAQVTASQTTAAKKNNQPETIYVEADDSHGRVWGHVTMKGDRGTGTIHDEGENTWAVTVTRHGDELFAVDQNSRQYVFKLKK